MREQGDPWLFELLMTNREHVKGKIKPYHEHSSYTARYHSPVIIKPDETPHIKTGTASPNVRPTSCTVRKPTACI